MKRFLIVSFLSISCLIESLGQEPIHMEETFNVNSRKHNVSAFIYDCMTKEGFVKTDSLLYGGGFNGFVRRGIYKDKFSCKCTVSFAINHGHVAMNYNVDSVYVNRMICDGSMKHETFAATDFGLYLTTIQELIRAQVRRIRAYSSDGTYTAASQKTPLFYSLDYIIRDLTISYYRVIKSDTNLSAKQLYDIAENYYTYEFVNANFVLQTENKEQYYLVGKGLSAKEFQHFDAALGGDEIYDVPFIMRIDCRDGRVRIAINIDKYDYTYISHYHKSKSSYYPLQYQPFDATRHDGVKKCTENFESTVSHFFTDLEKAIKDGVAPLDNINNW